MVPDGWVHRRLYECADQRLKKFTPSAGDARPYVALEHLAQGRPALLGSSSAGSATSAKTVFYTGDILFGKLRPKLRKAAVAPFDGVCSTDILPLFGKDGLDSPYLLQLAQWNRLQWHAIATSSGTKMPRTSWKQLGEFTFLLPPLSEQRKIAAILSSVDDAIDKTQAVIDQAKIVKRGLMQELFTRGLPTPYSRRFKVNRRWNFPEGWMDMALGEMATVVGGGTPKRSEPAFWDGNVPWATPTDVTGLSGRTISHTAASITERGLVSSSATLLPPNSLLMTTRATIGACAINRVAMATNQGFQNLVPKPGTCVDFLYYLMQHHVRGLEQLAAGSTFLEVSKRTVRGFRVLMPPLSEQHKIADILSSADDTIESHRRFVDRALIVKRGLMSVLLTGDLRVTPDTEAA